MPVMNIIMLYYATEQSVTCHIHATLQELTEGKKDAGLFIYLFCNIWFILFLFCTLAKFFIQTAFLVSSQKMPMCESRLLY